MSQVHRLEVDFNSRTPDGNIILGTPHEVASLFPEPMRDGVAVIIYEEADIEVQGTTAFNKEFRYWVVVPDGSTLKNL